MAAPAVDPQEVEQLLELGVRNRWYPIAPSWMVKDKPVGLTRLGERIVAWRDHDGEVRVLRDRCPHRGARLSEHAQGRAIDIGGLWLANGRKITVKQNWGKGSAGQFLRTIWKKACGPFKTVLGPGSDRFHQDHLHLDTAHRRRSFCR